MRLTYSSHMVVCNDLGGVHGVNRNPSLESFAFRLYRECLTEKHPEGTKYILCTPLGSGQRTEIGYLESLGFKNYGWSGDTKNYITKIEEVKTKCEEICKELIAEFEEKLKVRHKKDVEEKRVHPLHDIRKRDQVYPIGGHRSRLFKVSDVSSNEIYLVGLGKYYHSIEAPTWQRTEVD